MAGCDDISSIRTGQLEVSPTEIVFAKPVRGERRQRTGIDLLNVGSGPITIRYVELIEDDAVRELSILDGDDWSQPKVIDGNGRSQLTIAWDVLDAQPDFGRIIVHHNAGASIEIPVRTPDLDPLLTVETEPAGQPVNDRVIVTVSNAQAGQTQWARITLTNEELAALTVQRICLLTANDACSGTHQVGPFSLCEGRVSSIDDCQSPTPPDSINSDSLYVFSVGFTAPNSLGSVFSMPVLLETNDAKTPRFVIQVRGSTCLRDMENPTCGTCGNGAIDAMEACDDGNLDNEDGCRNDCTQPICGDGVRDGLEACDDGNEDDTDGCLSDCTLPRCGRRYRSGHGGV